MEQFENSSNEAKIFQQQPETIFEPEYASTGQRFINYLIDVIVFYIFMYGFAAIVLVGRYISETGQTNPDGGTFQILFTFVLLVFFVIYYTFCEGASHGRSIGKLITGTKAVKIDNAEITWTDALIRSLCRIVPFEPFSAFGGNPWHDKWSNTKVIKIR